MKKAILLAIIIAFSNFISTKAQFMPQLSATYESGCGSLSKGGGGADFVAAWGVGGHWRLGAGIGLHELNLNFVVDNTHNSKALKEQYVLSPGEYDESIAIIPLYFDAKLNLTKTKVRPYLNGRVGIDFLMTEMEEYQQVETSASAALYLGGGLDFSMKRGKLFVQCGYKIRDFDFEDTVPGVQLSIGYCWDKNQKVTTNKSRKGTIIK